MECPDIHKFPTNKRHRSRVKFGKIGDSGFKNDVRSEMLRLGGVTGLSLTLPSSSQPPEGDSLASHLTSVLKDDTQYYEVMDFCPALIFRKEFVSNFVNTGSLSILSHTHLDSQSYVLESLSFHDKTLNISILHRNVNM